MKPVEFEFALQQKVTIKEVKRPGTVTGLMQNGSAVKKYCVAFWNDGRRYEEWMYAFEIEAI